MSKVGYFMQFLQSVEFIILIGFVTFVIILGFGYRMLVKPTQKNKKYNKNTVNKKVNVSNKQLTSLIEKAQSSREDLRLLLKALLQTEKTEYKEFYQKLRVFDKKELSKMDLSDFDDLLTDLKKSC